jgi:hypothetical protein
MKLREGFELGTRIHENPGNVRTWEGLDMKNVRSSPQYLCRTRLRMLHALR